MPNKLFVCNIHPLIFKGETIILKSKILFCLPTIDGMLEKMETNKMKWDVYVWLHWHAMAIHHLIPRCRMPWSCLSACLCLFEIFSLNVEKLENIPWNIVSPTNHCYGSEPCYVSIGGGGEYFWTYCGGYLVVGDSRTSLPIFLEIESFACPPPQEPCRTNKNESIGPFVLRV